MAYGLSTRAFIEDGPVEQVAKPTPSHNGPLLARARTKPAASSSIEQRSQRRQRSHRRLPACSLSEAETGKRKELTMVDEIFDRHYQAGRSELNDLWPHASAASAAPSPTLSKYWSKSNIRHLGQQSQPVPAAIDFP